MDALGSSSTAPGSANGTDDVYPFSPVSEGHNGEFDGIEIDVSAAPGVFIYHTLRAQCSLVHLVECARVHARPPESLP